jgi:hypothetical protein
MRYDRLRGGVLFGRNGAGQAGERLLHANPPFRAVMRCRAGGCLRGLSARQVAVGRDRDTRCSLTTTPSISKRWSLPAPGASTATAASPASGRIRLARPDCGGAVVDGWGGSLFCARGQPNRRRLRRHGGRSGGCGPRRSETPLLIEDGCPAWGRKAMAKFEGLGRLYNAPLIAPPKDSRIAGIDPYQRMRAKL